VQRILVHDDVYDALRRKLVAKVKALKAGDPKKKTTFLGPMIDAAAAERLEGWIGEARKAGARVLCGGGRKGAMLEATLLENVPSDAKLQRMEAFGPVAVLQRFLSFDEALATVNDSDFGLQAGVFTNDLRHAMQAWDTLEQGGVIVNDVPSFRVDNMPYGGVKSSGLGREGVRYAIEDMSETRLMVIRDV
jgi:acyl-CoA reductase-like NAD-dependent aldehyde dehydrogenase